MTAYAEANQWCMALHAIAPPSLPAWAHASLPMELPATLAAELLLAPGTTKEATTKLGVGRDPVALACTRQDSSMGGRQGSCCPCMHKAGQQHGLVAGVGPG